MSNSASHNVFVSVLMTAFNREKYIAAAIQSVLDSSFKNFELIILDDCSTDGSYSIAQSFAQKDLRIRLYRNDNNLGQFTNRNKAISLATGKYIKFLDSDDEIANTGLEKMINAMESFAGAGIGVPVRKSQNAIPYAIHPHKSVLDHFMGENHLCYGPTGSIFLKEAVFKAGKFEPAYGILADTLLNIKIASQYDTVFFQEGLFHWRRHDEQVTEEQEDDVRMIGERYRINEAAIGFEKTPLTTEEQNHIRNNFVKINTRHFLHHLFSGKLKDALTIKKNTELNFLRIIKAGLQNKKGQVHK